MTVAPFRDVKIEMNVLIPLYSLPTRHIKQYTYARHHLVLTTAMNARLFTTIRYFLRV